MSLFFFRCLSVLADGVCKETKSAVVTTADSQKTNYLKTNLLKQIKIISYDAKVRKLWITCALLLNKNSWKLMYVKAMKPRTRRPRMFWQADVAITIFLFHT